MQLLRCCCFVFFFFFFNDTATTEIYTLSLHDALPISVEVVDLRHDGGYPLTRPLRDALGRIEDAGGRAILLQNRRGSAAAIHCRSCGHGWRCPRCAGSLSLHGAGPLVWPPCGLTRPPPAA